MNLPRNCKHKICSLHSESQRKKSIRKIEKFISSKFRQEGNFCYFLFLLLCIIMVLCVTTIHVFIPHLSTWVLFFSVTYFFSRCVWTIDEIIDAITNKGNSIILEIHSAIWLCDWTLSFSIFFYLLIIFLCFVCHHANNGKIKIERYCERCVFFVYWYNDVMWMWGEDNLICTNFWIMKRARWRANLCMCYVSIFEMDLTFTHRPSSLYLWYISIQLYLYKCV